MMILSRKEGPGQSSNTEKAPTKSSGQICPLCSVWIVQDILDLNMGEIILMLRIYSTGTDLHRQVVAAP